MRSVTREVEADLAELADQIMTSLPEGSCRTFGNGRSNAPCSPAMSSATSSRSEST